MDSEEFRKRGKEMIDYVADYLDNIRQHPPLSQVEPGYLKSLIPEEAPESPEKWEDVMKDIDRVIMPGVSHWQHPNFHPYFAAGNSNESKLADILSSGIGCIGFNWVTHWHSPYFHAYFPTSNSYPAICADILSDAIGCIGFSWAASPACTELEVVMMDWLGKMLQLPEDFLSGGAGGGVIHGTASEATLVALLAARSRVLRSGAPGVADHAPGVGSDDTSSRHEGKAGPVRLDQLVAYCSEQAHSSVERACLLGAVRCHSVESDENNRMSGDSLAAAMARDRERGLVPFYCVATLGTTALCAFDNLLEIGPVCREAGLWLHIDAAYAGAAFICPEFRPLLDGVEMADSFNFNPHKWLLVNFDCSAMWFRNSSHVVDAFNVDPLYLKHEHQDKMPDYRHWQIPLGRRFRSLKLWFVMRMYGVKGLQEHIRKQVSLAREFEEKVRKSECLEVYGEVTMGLVCFRLKGSNEVNESLLASINKDGRIHLVPSTSKGVYFLRFAVCATRTESRDIQFAYDVITELATRLVAPQENGVI